MFLNRIPCILHFCEIPLDVSFNGSSTTISQIPQFYWNQIVNTIAPTIPNLFIDTLAEFTSN